MSLLLDKITQSRWSKWTEEEDAQFVEHGKKLYDAYTALVPAGGEQSSKWHAFNAAYDRGDVGKLRELMKEEVKPKAKVRWRAEYGENYFYAWVSAKSYPEKGDCSDDAFYAMGDYFQTEEEAAFEYEKRVFITKVNDRIDELNDGWVPDWNGLDNKFTIEMEHNGLFLRKTIYGRLALSIKYMKSKEIGIQIIEEFKDGLLKYIFN